MKHTIDECIAHLENHMGTCDIIIASFRGAHKRFEEEQKELYADCIEALKELKNIKEDPFNA